MSITPYLLYEDVGGALKFLSKAFGFRKYGTKMLGPDGKINHAAMQPGEDLIMMGYPGPKYRNPRRLGQATQSLYINVDDADSHFEQAKKQAPRLSRNPKTRSMVTAAMALRIPRGISGTLRKKSAKDRDARSRDDPPLRLKKGH